MAHRILLVDDDLLELERAAAAGLQTYAAPAVGGLCGQDLEMMLASLKLPPCRPSSRPGMAAAEESMPYTASMTLFSTGQDTSLLSSSKRSCGRWRNLILFSGDCFEG